MRGRGFDCVGRARGWWTSAQRQPRPTRRRSAAAAEDVARQLDGLVGAGPVPADLRGIAALAAGAAWPATIQRAEGTAEVFDSPDLRVGVWVETARLAVLAGDTGSLASPRFLREGRRLMTADLAAPVSRGVGEVVEMLEATGGTNASALLGRLEGLLGR